MAIKAMFSPGQTSATVNGLHQWDWGRKLEIHDDSLPALVEVHFACPGMTAAVVRSCAVVSGVTTAVIPDVCIEQTAPIVAWVVAVGEISGETIRTITLPIIQRTRPEPSATIPTSVSDRYTESVAALNTAVAQIEAGAIVSAKATHAADAAYAANAERAGYADEAGYAEEAGTATSADSATSATNATNASKADKLRVTDRETSQGFTDVTYDSDIWTHDPIAGGIYIIRVRQNNYGEQTRCGFLFEFKGYCTTYSAPFQYDDAKGVSTAVVKAEASTEYPGCLTLHVVEQPLSTASEIPGFTISVRCISEYYSIG